MKFKPAQLKPLSKVLAILILVILVAVALLFAKSRFIKPMSNNQLISSTANSQLPPLPGQKFAPRDPNLTNEQNLVKDYLANHLTALSPTKAVLGGTFHLTDIKFNGNNEAVISYEDGHIALQADVNYEINPQDLKINDFKIIKTN
jgi:hypothetical protein